MTAITQALATGYGEEEILKYIAKAAPSLAKSISKATSAGHSVSNVLGFLSKTMQDDEYDPYLSQEAGHKKVAKRREKATKELLKTAASGAALYGAARAVPSAIQGIKGAFQGNQPPSGIGPQPMGGAPVQPGQVQTPPIQQQPSQPLNTGGVAQNAPQPPIQPQGMQPPQQPAIQTSAVNSAQIINSMGIAKQVQNLAQAGNTPEAIATAVGVSLKPNQRKWLDEQIQSGAAKALPDMVEDFLAQSQPSQQPAPLIQTEQPIKTGVQPEEILPSERAEIPQEKEQKMPAKEHESFSKFMKPYREKLHPEKGTIVSTPDGEVGEVQDIRKNESLVNEDGKLHKVKLSDLQLPDEKIQQTVARLLEIPEIDKSSLINYWAYDPEDKQLIAMYHNGESYKYLDVPEELEAQLLEASTVPKTKGENIFGAWSQEDEMSRGATLSKLFIQHPKYKRAKKGEAPNPYYRKLRKGYDYWAKLKQ